MPPTVKVLLQLVGRLKDLQRSLMSRIAEPQQAPGSTAFSYAPQQKPYAEACQSAAGVPEADVQAALARCDAAGAACAPAREALAGYYAAHNTFFRGDIAAARAALDAVWRRFPAKDGMWHGMNSPPGSMYGLPVAYYGLQMLETIVQVRAQASHSGIVRAKYASVATGLILPS